MMESNDEGFDDNEVWPRLTEPPTRSYQRRDCDCNFELLLNNQIDELDSEIRRHHKDFESISALCTLWRNKRMDSDEALKYIQNIVG